MSTCNIKYLDEEYDIDYHFDDEELIIDQVVECEYGLIVELRNISPDDFKGLEAKVLQHIEDQKISSKEADWADMF